jgi:hypothetical protein
MGTYFLSPTLKGGVLGVAVAWDIAELIFKADGLAVRDYVVSVKEVS